MIGHVGVLDFLLVCLRYFVAYDLVHRHTTLGLHLQEGGSARLDHLSVCLVLRGFDPSGGAINIMEDHLVVAATT